MVIEEGKINKNNQLRRKERVLKNISTHLFRVSTVVGEFALAVAIMFGVQTTPEVQAATCTVDFSTTGAGNDADKTCRVEVGTDLVVTVKTDQIEKVQGMEK